MWITRSRYEQLVQAEARTKAADRELVTLRYQLAEMQGRLDRAVDNLLTVRELPGLTPPEPPTPAPLMFEDDPEVLAEWKKGAPSPLEALFESAGDKADG